MATRADNAVFSSIIQQRIFHFQLPCASKHETPTRHHHIARECIKHVLIPALSTSSPSTSVSVPVPVTGISISLHPILPLSHSLYCNKVAPGYTFSHTPVTHEPHFQPVFDVTCQHASAHQASCATPVAHNLWSLLHLWLTHVALWLANIAKGHQVGTNPAFMTHQPQVNRAQFAK